MNLIQCSLNCKYQKNGVCGLENSALATTDSAKDCIYFTNPD